MSGFDARFLRSVDAQRFSTAQGDAGHSQHEHSESYERTPDPRTYDDQLTMAESENGGSDISAVQKMLAATSGSLLTSLLGEHLTARQAHSLYLSADRCSNSPRCCSRPPAITNLLTTVTTHIGLSNIHSLLQSSSESWGDSLLSRGFLGE